MEDRVDGRGLETTTTSGEKSRPATSAIALVANGRNPVASRGMRVATIFGQRPSCHGRGRKEVMPCMAVATTRASLAKGRVAGSMVLGVRLNRVAIKRMETRPAKDGPARSEAINEKGKAPAASEAFSRPMGEAFAQALSRTTTIERVRSQGRTQTAHPQTEGARSMRKRKLPVGVFFSCLIWRKEVPPL